MTDLHYLLPAALCCALWLAVGLPLARGFHRLPRLEDAPEAAGPLPSLSVIVPACNEASTIEPAMLSLLRAGYPGVEVIALNDRSTDDTGTILDRLARENASLRVIHIGELPAGWLGKCHALHIGARAARGDWLLFTDADVCYEPGALSRAVQLAAYHRLDHFVALPEFVAHGFWERVLLPYFAAMLHARYRTWECWNPRGWGYVGIGAFSLVRAAAYHALGGHEPLRLEVVDDMELGRRFRRAGRRCGMALATGWIRVHWASGLRGFVSVLTKNLYAGLDYSPLRLTGTVLGAPWMAAWPFVGLSAGSPTARLLCLCALAGMLLTATALQPATRVSPLWSLAWPAAAAVFSWTALRSAWQAERRGGVQWRGVLYPLRELRAAARRRPR